MSSSNGIKQRGPLLPRADLTNQSPEDGSDTKNEGNGNADLVLKVSTSSSSIVVARNKPPQHTKRKAKKSLPAKSTRYGRNSTPIIEQQRRRRSSSSYSVQPSSPANSIASASRIRSRRSSFSASYQLRHGDGSLPGCIIANNNGKATSATTRFNFKKQAKAANKAANVPKAVKRRASCPSPKWQTKNEREKKSIDRSRTLSPAVKHQRCHDELANFKKEEVANNDKDSSRTSGPNARISSNANSENKSGRSRPPSPTAVKQQQGGGDHLATSNAHAIGSNERRAAGSNTRHRASVHALSRSSAKHNQRTRQASPLPNDSKDYSEAFADDPTPVKEARRLSSLFQHREARMGGGQISVGSIASGDKDKASNLHPGFEDGMLQNAVPNVASPAMAVAASSPLSTMKLFQPNETDATIPVTGHIQHKNAHTDLLLEGCTDLNQSETSLLSAELFSHTSGIDTANVQRLLSKKSTGSKQWELRKRLEKKEEELVVVRTTCQDLLGGKEQFVDGAIQIETRLRNKLAKVHDAFQTCSNENTTFRDEDVRLKERVSQLIRERDHHRTKCETISSELGSTKEEVVRLQKSHTEKAITLALVESKLQESNTREESMLANVERLESSKVKKIEEARSEVAREMGKEISEMKSENGALRMETRLRREREESICRLLDVDVALVDGAVNKPEHAMAVNASSQGDTDGEVADSLLNLIQHRLKGFEESVKAKGEIERELESCSTLLEKVKVDYQAALETVAAKDRDMSELTKSICDIQRSSQCREQDIAHQRKASEVRAAASESQLVKCREKIQSSDYEIKFLEEALEASEAECTTSKNAVATLQKEIDHFKVKSAQQDSLRAKAEEKESEEHSERIALAAQLNAQLQEHARVEKQLRESMEITERSLTQESYVKEEESKAKDAEIGRMEEAITTLEAHQLSLKQSLSEQKSMLDATNEEEIGRLMGEIANLQSKQSKMQSTGVVSEAKVRELEEVIRTGRTERKRMHNIIQELRGNVRVFARIRPFLPDDGKWGAEKEGTSAPFVSHYGDDMVTVTKRNDPRQRHQFSFDRVFAPSAGQETVYEEVSEFVQSALDGYNVTLFSYGQTGSGKTHTMQGTGVGVMRGLIPRSIDQIGEHQVQLKNDGWTFSVEMSFLEIYNESLRDLLRDDRKEECKHEIQVSSDGRRSVTNLTVQSIDPNDRASTDAVLALAAKRRSTVSTDMNATSSRSHSVFTLNLTAKHDGRNQMMRGTLNLVDLAGSERLNRSNVEGRHAKETMSINKSLSSLADVFTAIGQKQSHVPFRNSKLSFLLQPSLSGDGKTLMVVNISPTEASVQESLCSLRFASKVNKCELGKAKRTIEKVKSSEKEASSEKCNATTIEEAKKNKKMAASSKRNNTTTIEDAKKIKFTASSKRGAATTIEEAKKNKCTSSSTRGNTTTIEKVKKVKCAASSKRDNTTTIEVVKKIKVIPSSKRGTVTTSSKSSSAVSRNVKRKM